MSWQEYVDNNLMCPLDHEGNTLASAALVGLENSVWAKSPNFPELTVEEMEVMKGIFEGKNPGSFTMGGVKYMVLGSEDPETKLRGKRQGGGCSVVKTGKTMVVGIYDSPDAYSQLASACIKIVETLAEYLISVDY